MYEYTDEEGIYEALLNEASLGDEGAELASSFMEEETLKYQEYRSLMSLAESVIEIPDGTHPRAEELIQALADAAPSMSRAQIAELFHSSREVLSEVDPKLQYVESMLSEAGRFTSRLVGPMLRALRKVDTEDLKTFLKVRAQKPYLGPAELNAAWRTDLAWEPIVRKRLARHLPEADIDTIIGALYETYEYVYIGGNSGMGLGEVLYLILSNGSKPQQGDLKVEGVGELEIKGSGGRMRGVTIPVGSTKVTFKAIMKMIESKYPEIVEAMPRLPKTSPKGSSSFLSLSQTGIDRTSYPIMNEVLGTDERRAEFYTDLWSTYFSTLHENHTSLDNRLLDGIIESFAMGEFETGAVAIAAAQYALYADADGFDGMILVNPYSFFLIKGPEDIIAEGSIRKGGGGLKVDPPSIAPGDEPGAAAGLSISWDKDKRLALLGK